MPNAKIRNTVVLPALLLAACGGQIDDALANAVCSQLLVLDALEVPADV